MNLLTVVVMLGTMVCFVSSHPKNASPRHPPQYDNVDIDSILKNERVLTNHIKCILDKGPCTQEGRDFKEHLPVVISTTCEKCTSAEKKIVRKAAKYIKEKKKDVWEEIRRKYDPVNKHYENFLMFMNES